MITFTCTHFVLSYLCLFCYYELATLPLPFFVSINRHLYLYLCLSCYYESPPLPLPFLFAADVRLQAHLRRDVEAGVRVRRTDDSGSRGAAGHGIPRRDHR